MPETLGAIYWSPYIVLDIIYSLYLLGYMDQLDPLHIICIRVKTNLHVELRILTSSKESHPVNSSHVHKSKIEIPIAKCHVVLGHVGILHMCKCM